LWGKTLKRLCDSQLMPKHKNYIHNTSVPVPSPRGEKGQKGVTGIHGTNGRKGDRGLKGSAGLDGHTTTIVGSFKVADPATLPKSGTIPVGWDDGVNPPIPFSLEVGEAIIDLRTSDLWCFTPASNTHNWTKMGKLAGPRGTNGSDGAQGFKGEAGIAGTDGRDGEKGGKGKKGEQGNKGLLGGQGDKGGKGNRGPGGINGTNGSNGPKGQTGTPGIHGCKGLPGASITGEKGQKGFKGAPGTRGVNGLRGVKGEATPSNLVPKVGGTINFANGGLFDKHNIAKAEILEHGVVKIFFQSPLVDKNYTVVSSAQMNDADRLATVQIIERDTRFVTISLLSHETGQPMAYGVVSLLIYKFS